MNFCSLSKAPTLKIMSSNGEKNLIKSKEGLKKIVIT